MLIGMNKESHFSGKVAVKAMIVDGDKVLITRSEGDTLWDLPGGRINEGESLEEAVAREIKEELGVEIVVKRLLCSEQSLHRKDGKYIMFVTFEAALANPENVSFVPNEESEEIRWIDRSQYDAAGMFDQCPKPFKKLWGMD